MMIDNSLFNGTIRAFAYYWRPYISVDTVGNQTIVSGPLMDLLQYIAQGWKINCSVFTSQSKWGKCSTEVNNDENLDRCLIKYKMVDISLHPLLMTYDDLQYGIYTHPFVITDMRVLSGRPSPSPTSIFRFLRTFQGEVLLVLLFSGIIVLLCIVISEAISNNCRLPRMFEVFTYCFYLCAKFLGKDFEWKPILYGANLVIFFWSMAAFILCNVFNGDMTSSFFLMETPPFIQKVDDFLQFKNVTPIVWFDSTESSFLKDYHIEPYIEIWKRISEKKSFLTYEDYSERPLQFADKVSSTNYAWIAIRSSIVAMLRRVNLRADCANRNFHIGDHITTVYLALMVRSDLNSMLVDDVNKRILRMQQADLLTGEFYEARKDYTRCLDKEILPLAKTLKLNQLFGVFLMAIFGFILSSVVFIMEFVWNWKEKGKTP